MKPTSKPQRRLTKLKETGSRASRVDADLFHDQENVYAPYASTLTLPDRQQLKEQLTGTTDITSPVESVTSRPSRDNLRLFAMGRKDRSRISTLNVTGSVEDGPMLSPALSFHTAIGVPTHINETLDIAATIKILQELRKTATPEELVSLHRALLPTKEVLEPIESPEYDQPPASRRRRSNMPPGLATRDVDPLRRYGEAARRPVSHIPRHAPSTYFDAVERAEPEPQRPYTPVDYAGQAGVYRTGTLRIMNGSASPASSMHFRESVEIQDAVQIKIMQHTRVSSMDYGQEMSEHRMEESSDGTSTPVDTSLINENDLLDRLDTEAAQDVLEEPHGVNELLTDDLHHAPELSPQRTNTVMRHYDEFCGSPYDRKVSSESHATSSSNDSATRFVTPKPSMAVVSDHSRPELPRPDIVSVDSGYGSEGSANAKPDLTRVDTNKTPVKTLPLEDQRWLTALPAITKPETASARYSLYTFEQVVNSPTILGVSHSSPLMRTKDTPSPKTAQPAVTKRSTLFSSLRLSRSPSSKIVETAEAITPISADEEEGKTGKRNKPKKLHKKVPQHIKDARKELKRLEDAAVMVEEKQTAQAPPQQEDTPSKRPQTSAEQDFRTRAPRAYARIRAASSASDQQWEQARHSVVRHDSKQQSFDEMQSPNDGNADGDDVSVINFRAVARSLGASPYDVSTSQFKSSIDYIVGSEDSTRIQSPFEIGQGIPGPRTHGMSEQAASELARQKSRDYVEPTIDPLSRPISASPRPRGPRAPVPAEMPPLPSLPDDFESKARRSQQMVARSLGEHDMPSEEVQEQKVLVSERPQPPESGQPVDTVDWNTQAKLWRERREALGLALQQPETPKAHEHTDASVSTPALREFKLFEPTAIVSESDSVETTSRPTIRELKSAQSPLDRLCVRAEQIHNPTQPTQDRSLLTVDTARISHAQSVLSDARAAIYQRVHSPVSPLEDGKSARQLSPVSDLSVPTPSPSPIQAPRGPRPPSRAALADTSGRFPAEYLARLNSTTPEPPSVMSAASTNVSHEPPKRAAPPVPVARPTSAHRSTPVPRPTSSHLTAPDRYSGGFQYEWERGSGVGGSAGTRSNVNAESAQRSLPAKVVYGLDLTDVPVFLQKQSTI